MQSDDKKEVKKISIYNNNTEKKIQIILIITKSFCLLYSIKKILLWIWSHFINALDSLCTAWCTHTRRETNRKKRPVQVAMCWSLSKKRAHKPNKNDSFNWNFNNSRSIGPCHCSTIQMFILSSKFRLCRECFVFDVQLELLNHIICISFSWLQFISLYFLLNDHIFYC